ncbi:tRNA isopentenyltransferase, partial [Artomyces pyxidatus]
MSLHPLITICGTTGVGKSKLAVELALRLAQDSCSHGWNGARIINADAMQVYRGFDVITNKIPFQERRGVEHLLMDFKDPREQYVVGQWVHDAIRVIDETHRRNQVPIVVGGTSYWIQHLVFPNRLVSDPIVDSPAAKSTVSQELTEALVRLSPDMRGLFDFLPETPPSAAENPEAALSLHKLLSALDPTVASRWHWRDTRKVLRSLVIIRDTGRRASDIIKGQSQTAAIPRYRTLCLWLYADPAALTPRLNARVDDMLQNGLLEEVRQMRAIVSETCSLDNDVQPSSDQENATIIEPTLGVFQSIGFKELDRYISDPSPTDIKYTGAVEEIKNATRKYAKRQVSWIRNKLLPALSSSKRSVQDDDVRSSRAYLLDATELGDKWISNVRDPAANIAKAFLKLEPMPDPFSTSGYASEMLATAAKPTDPTAVLAARQKIVCPTCTLDDARPVMIEEGSEWSAHQKTKAHQRLASKAKRTDTWFQRQHVQREKVEHDDSDGGWSQKLLDG